MKKRNVKQARLLEIYRRQDSVAWGPKYVPAQLASKTEAPKISRNGELPSLKLQRMLHAMSGPELDVFPLAMYHPALIDFKEGMIMQVEASDHPLVGHRKAIGLQLPTTSGTDAIVERLGFHGRHPRIRAEDRDEEGNIFRFWAPWPWILDPMLFLEDAQGPYCISWDIKRSSHDHGMPGPGDYTERQSPRAIEKAKIRDLVYQEYMRELSIRIVRVAQADIPRSLATNLRHLLIQHAQLPDIDPVLHGEMLLALDEAFRRGNPPIEVMTDFAKSGVTPRLVMHCLEHAIFERRIRVDLYQRCMPDRPMIPEQKDVLVEFSHWFER